MSSQLSNVRERRTQLAKQYEAASGANRAGLEKQLAVLDQRLEQLEADMSESGRLLTTANVGQLGTSTSPPQFFRGNPNAMAGIGIMFTLFVLAPMAFSVARLVWRRASRPMIARGGGLDDAAQRFDRLEQAIDAIAIEVERVSESQRFMTRIMTQSAAPQGANAGAGSDAASAVNGQAPPLALGSGSPEQLFAPQREEEAERIRRR